MLLTVNSTPCNNNSDYVNNSAALYSRPIRHLRCCTRFLYKFLDYMSPALLHSPSSLALCLFNLLVPRLLASKSSSSCSTVQKYKHEHVLAYTFNLSSVARKMSKLVHNVRAYVTPNLWNCPFHEMGKRIAQFAKWALCLPISRNGQYHCRFREMGNTMYEIFMLECM